MEMTRKRMLVLSKNLSKDGVVGLEGHLGITRLFLGVSTQGFISTILKNLISLYPNRDPFSQT